jgi:hypothetical protein
MLGKRSTGLMRFRDSGSISFGSSRANLSAWHAVADGLGDVGTGTTRSARRAAYGRSRSTSGTWSPVGFQRPKRL